MIRSSALCLAFSLMVGCGASQSNSTTASGDYSRPWRAWHTNQQAHHRTPSTRVVRRPVRYAVALVLGVLGWRPSRTVTYYVKPEVDDQRPSHHRFRCCH